jgi:hypothetical protein
MELKNSVIAIGEVERLQSPDYSSSFSLNVFSG